MHTFVIAEIGSAWRFWDGQSQIENAREAIRMARDSGADAIKFQWVSDPRLMEQRRKVSNGSYEVLAWPEEWIEHFAAYCKSLNLEFMCTVFLRCDVLAIHSYVKRWKVASLENQNEPLKNAMRQTGKPILVSLGATGVLSGDWYGCETLHCTAAYPAPLDSLNLSAIRSFAYTGYSDHSRNELTGAIAVACGAKIVEVHFKLFDTPVYNPDYGHSLTSSQLRQYIANIRMAELMLGDGVKRVMPCEEWALQHKVTA